MTILTLNVCPICGALTLRNDSKQSLNSLPSSPARGTTPKSLWRQANLLFSFWFYISRHSSPSPPPIPASSPSMLGTPSPSTSSPGAMSLTISGGGWPYLIAKQIHAKGEKLRTAKNEGEKTATYSCTCCINPTSFSVLSGSVS